MAPDEFVLDVLGAQVGVEFTGPAKMHATTVMEPWSRCLTTETDIRGVIPRVRLVSGNPAGVADRLSRQVTLRAIEQQQRRLLMLHAGAVCRNDQAIAFVAASGGGKTTAVRTLAARYGYLTDETTAVDDSFRVFPFPKPLSVLQPTGQWKHQLSPDAAGLAEPTHRRPELRQLLILDRRAGIGRPYLTRLDPADALTALASQISYLSALPRPLHRLAALIEHCGGVLQVSYTEATDLFEVVDDLLNTPSVVESQLDSPSADGPAEVAGAHSRVQVTDQLEIGSRTAVLVNNRLLMLDGVGAAVWRALGRSADLDMIVDAVTTELGRPASNVDPSSIVRTAIAQLAEAGLLLEESA